MSVPGPSDAFLEDHAELLISSYRRLTGKALFTRPGDRDRNPGQALYEAPFGVVSHGTEKDPVFNYANRTAQKLFEMDWEAFTRMPSRKSAERVNRAERARLLDRVSRNGYIDDYRGVRISDSARRFWIERATVWNLVDDRGVYRGQAAVFHHWRDV